jgi:ABC-type nitrate/sulfonate/bicarbonate transport system substrate-binding protein
MSRPVAIDFASQDHEAVRPLADGTVPVAGVTLTHHALPPPQMFARLLGKGEFAVSEIAMGLYLSTLELDDPPFIAIPVFVTRAFRHGAIYVRTDGSIREPRDLIGKRVGEFNFYGHDAGLWAKGILADAYGVRHDAYTYAIGGLGTPLAPPAWVPSHAPPGVTIRHIGTTRTLDELLGAREIDAIIAPIPPPSMLIAKTTRRSIEPTESIECAYYEKTGIWPFMHTIVIRRAIYREHPWIASALYTALCEAKRLVMQRWEAGMEQLHTTSMMPWLGLLHERVEDVMGHDWWPYGLEGNRAILETVMRYHREQHQTGMTCRIEELFAPETLL